MIIEVFVGLFLLEMSFRMKKRGGNASLGKANFSAGLLLGLFFTIKNMINFFLYVSIN